VSRAEIGRRLDGPDPVTWVFTGDSITQGAVYTYGARSYSEHFQERVRWELGRLPDLVLNTAVSSYTGRDLLARFDQLVTAFRPTVTSVMLGTNDAVEGRDGIKAFGTNIAEIISRIEGQGSIALLNTPPPAAIAESPDVQYLAHYVEEMLQVAHDRDVVVVDHYRYWIEVGDGAVPRWLLDDAIHPNAHGHIELAVKLFSDLGIFDIASPTCRLAASAAAAHRQKGELT
jgi:acyl-CoA thioesterase-1